MTIINQIKMEYSNATIMREDRQLLMLTHLSQLLDLVTGIGGFIVPLVIWLTQKDKVLGMDAHGKMILNFPDLYFYLFDNIDSANPVVWNWNLIADRYRNYCYSFPYP